MSELAIPDLKIENFRCFRELSIEKLARVNLITGRNAVGKSFVLEALELYASRGDLGVLLRQLQTRGDLAVSHEAVGGRTWSKLAQPLESLAALFYGWSPDVTGRSLRVQTTLGELAVELVQEPLGRSTSGVAGDAEEDPQSSDGQSEPRLLAKWDGKRLLHISLFGEVTADLGLRNPQIKRRLDDLRLPVCSWRLGGPDFAALARMWSAVELLPAGARVREAMKLLHPGLEGLNFRQEGNGADRFVPQVKLAGMDRVIPLESLGDGSGRILAIALGLVSVQGGILLLDEVETGLHYSVESDLWRMVFKTARELNVQVFATTHSWDCIEAFQEAAAEADDDEGRLIRLQRKEDRLYVTTFDREDLAVVARHEIEVR